METFLTFLNNQNILKRTILVYCYWANKYIEKYKISKIDLQKYIALVKNKYSINSQKVIFSALAYLFEFYKIKIKIKHQNQTNYFISNFINKKDIDNIIFKFKYKNPKIETLIKNICFIFWMTGLRANELINLKWSNIQKQYIKILGKGNKFRLLPYKSNLFHNFKKLNSDFVFSIKEKNISYSYLYKLIKKISLFLKKDISPHSFRHGYATRLLDNGVPLVYVSEALGHNNINTTMIYLHLDMKKKIKAFKKAGW